MGSRSSDSQCTAVSVVIVVVVVVIVVAQVVVATEAAPGIALLRQPHCRADIQ